MYIPLMQSTNDLGYLLLRPELQKPNGPLTHSLQLSFFLDHLMASFGLNCNRNLIKIPKSFLIRYCFSLHK